MSPSVPSFGSCVDNKIIGQRTDGDQNFKYLWVDLGAGPGYQSIALSRLGFRPVAVDTSSELLEDLAVRAPGIPIYYRDFRDLSFVNNLQPELVVCMGDTLTHLRSIGEVQSVIEQSYRLFQPQGRLILTF